MKHNHFIQNLPSGALDIVGDVHGEWAVLQQLLRHLGYDERGEHPQGRRLVFIGDIVDRGPDSPAALAWVMRAREQHGVKILPSPCSSSVRNWSRCNASPSIRLVRQVPQMPSSHETGTK